MWFKTLRLHATQQQNRVSKTNCVINLLTSHHSTGKQQTVNKNLLRDESSAFPREHNEAVCYKKKFIKMDIKLFDDFPVAKTYNIIFLSLYVGVRIHVHDLLNKAFLCKFNSSYAFVEVSVRRETGICLLH